MAQLRKHASTKLTRAKGFFAHVNPEMLWKVRVVGKFLGTQLAWIGFALSLTTISIHTDGLQIRLHIDVLQMLTVKCPFLLYFISKFISVLKSFITETVFTNLIDKFIVKYVVLESIAQTTF